MKSYFGNNIMGKFLLSDINNISTCFVSYTHTHTVNRSYNNRGMLCNDSSQSVGNC